MDYEKKYNDALERAKDCYVNKRFSELEDTPKEICEYIFPELAGSEDERIRKDLIGGLMWQRDNLGRLGPHDDNLILPGFCENVGKHLDWLEKQKEQKPWKVGANAYFTPEQKPTEVDESTKRLNDNWMKQHFDDYEEQKPVMSRAQILHQLFQNGSITLSDYLYLTGEQKPAEIAPNQFDGITYGMQGYSTEKPAEWSDEDEDILNCCISSIEEAKENRYAYKETDEDTSYDHEISWLKSLRPKPREEIYHAAKHNLAIWFMNYLDENRPEGKMSLSNGECEDIDKAFKENDWAKIMRYIEKYSPSWKPSGEDIKMLEHIIGQYETGNKNSKVMGYLPRVEELSFLKNVLSKWKN